MSKRASIIVFLITALLLLNAGTSSAQVDCWAPGMTTSITLTETSGSRSVTLGKPYRYDVFGVAGTLELGDRAKSTTTLNGVFKQKLLGLLGTGTTVSSTSYVMLQTGLLKTYPERLTTTGSQVGTSVGPVLQYGQNWTLCDPKNPVNVNLTFHLAGSSGITALLPGLLEPAYCNVNPKGHFYVLGEYHQAPPTMTGALNVSADQMLTECPVTLSYQVVRNETPVYRPPFLGLDLGDVNLTVIGTPPSAPAQPSGGTQATVRINPTQVSVTIDLRKSQGEGWARTSANR